MTDATAGRRAGRTLLLIAIGVAVALLILVPSDISLFGSPMSETEAFVHLFEEVDPLLAIVGNAEPDRTSAGACRMGHQEGDPIDVSLRWVAPRDGRAPDELLGQVERAWEVREIEIGRSEFGDPPDRFVTRTRRGVQGVWLTFVVDTRHDEVVVLGTTSCFEPDELFDELLRGLRGLDGDASTQIEMLRNRADAADRDEH